MKTKNIFAKLFFTGIFILNLLLPSYFSAIYAYSTSNFFSENDLSNLSALESNNFLDSIIILSCKDTVINSLEDNCSQALVTLSMNAETDCSLSNQLNWTYALDLNNDGTINHIGNSSLIQQNMAYGTHQVTWIAQNSCGNSETCVQKITVKDGQKPKLVCLDIVGDLVPGRCTLEIFASDFVFINRTMDNCPGPYTYSFDSTGLSTFRIFTIANYGENPITVYMRDVQNNISNCKTSITLQQRCIPGDYSYHSIQGHIKGINGQTKNGMSVFLEQIFKPTAIKFLSGKTDTNGIYTTDSLLNFDVDYKLYPKYNQEIRNGINILDIISLQKHLLGTRTITDPYLLFAADIDNSGSYTTTDLFDLKMALLGLIDSFPSNQSFRFVRNTNLGNSPLGSLGNYTFSEFNPLDFSSSYNFTMVKIGDLNQSFTLKEPSIEEINYPTRLLTLSEKQVELGEEFVFKIGNTQDLIGMQGTLEFDPKKAEYLKVQSQTHLDNINTKSKENGQIGFITDEQTPEIGFVFKAIQKQNLAETFIFSNAQLPSLSVDKQLNLNKVQLAFAQENKKFEFDFDIYPNPMNEILNINCNYPSNESGSLVLYSMDGRFVLDKEIQFTFGFNHFTINLSDLQVEGLLILELKTGQYVQQKKIFKTISK